MQAYFLWKEKHGCTVRPLPAEYEARLADDSAQRTLLCPASGGMMLRYRVGHGLNFQIDRSPTTGGVWLDAGEWEALKSKGLHDEMHLIFTAPYQKRVREERFNIQLQENFKTRIGEGDFEKVREFKAWLSGHAKRRDVLAFLIDEGDEVTGAG